MSSSHPLSHIRDAEAALVASIDRATQAVHAVGSELDAALARLQAATESATARLHNASEIVRRLTGNVLVAAGAVMREIDEAVVANDPPTVAPADATGAIRQSTTGTGADEQHGPADAGRSTASSVPSWLSGGIVGAIADAAQDDAADGPRTAQDRACRFGTPEEPLPRPEAQDAPHANGTHTPPSGRNGKHKRR